MTERGRNKSWLPAAAAAALALALYAVTLGGTYVYDDIAIIQEDPRITHPQRWGEFWTRDYFNGGPDNLYRPLVSMSYAIQTWLHGNDDRHAWAFHVVNWIAHAIACALVAELARRLTGFRVAMIAGLLFAAHPIHIEAVANIVGRAELFCAIGILGALVLVLRTPLTLPRAIAIWACFVLALLSKEQGVLLPPVLLVAWMLRPKSPDPIPKAQRQIRLWLILLIVWTAAAYFVWHEYILKFGWDRNLLDPTMNPLKNSAGWNRILVPLAVLGRYLALLSAPVKLSLDYGASVTTAAASLSDPFLWLGLLGAVAWFLAMIWSLHTRNRIGAFALFAFALFYGMVSNLLALIGTSFNERLMYIPSIFFLLLVALGLASLRRRLTIVLVSLLLMLYSLRSVTYAWQWNDRLRIYSYGLDQQPQSIRLHLLLAGELKARGSYDEAISVLRQAKDIDPNYWRTWIRLAEVALAKGDLAAAGAYFDRARKLDGRAVMTPAARELNQRRSSRPAGGPGSRPGNSGAGTSRHPRSSRSGD